jgi:peroxiredoxin/outer membrane lipoprotein-sorting protein
MRSHHHPISAAVLSRTLSALFALACMAFPLSAQADEGADALLAKADARLFAAQSLSARFVISTLHPTRYSDTQERGVVTLAKPDRTRIEITRYRKPVDADRWIASGNGSTVVSDGQSAHTLVWHPQSAQVRTSVSTPTTPARILGSLDPLRGFFEASHTGAQNRLLGERTWENARYTVVEQTVASADRREAHQEPQEESREIYIGADSLIHREVVHLVIDGKPVVREINLRDVRIDPTLSSDTFAFKAPAEATVIAPVAPQPLLAVGADAPDFQVEDAGGKPVRLAEFRGKVVLLKFFATWCWTCKESLPSTNALAGKYRKQDVIVLAVDIWNSREAFRAWTAKTPYHAIRFAHDPRPQGTEAAGALYHVTATPTEFVIDRDGKIASVSTGYEGPNAHLEQAIAAVLSGRPLAQASPGTSEAPSTGGNR